MDMMSKSFLTSDDFESSLNEKKGHLNYFYKNYEETFENTFLIMIRVFAKKKKNNPNLESSDKKKYSFLNNYFFFINFLSLFVRLSTWNFRVDGAVSGLEIGTAGSGVIGLLGRRSAAPRRSNLRQYIKLIQFTRPQKPQLLATWSPAFPPIPSIQPWPPPSPYS